ncbi:MAG: radical SAM/SPASM domain-containing protein [Candidatus Zixiibacteriota bacterium]
MNRLLHIFKLGWAYRIAKSVTLSYPPFQYTLEPTNVCNLNCSFCPQSDPEHHRRRPHGKLTEENFRLFLHRLKEADPGNDKLNLTLDGEPFLNQLTPRFMELAAEAGYVTVLATNGTLLDRATTDRLAAGGHFHLSIDFAADSKIFETIRARSGQYDIVLKNLNYLIEKAADNRNVNLSINDIASFAGERPETSLKKMRALFPVELPSRIKFTSRQFHNFCGHLPAHKTSDRYRVCPYPWTQLAVTWSGDCVACCRDTAGRTVLGNVFENPVMAIWNGESYHRFRQNLLDGKPERNAACKNCDLPYSGGEKRWKIGYVINSLLGR